MSPSINEFLKVTGEVARGYLATGGPITRLEERLTQAGHVCGLQCEVYATPTAVFVTAKKGKEVVTTLERATENTINFTDMLFYDSILDKLSTGVYSISQAEGKLQRFETRKYKFLFVALSAFLIGFVASFPRYGSFIGAFISGLIAALIYILHRPLGRKLQFSGVFTDFIGCLVAFVLSVLAATATGLGVPLFVIGSLILIVPGLTLTSAVSELAEHNFVSGTVKMMKSILILVAMGVSFLLVENVMLSLGFSGQSLSKVIPPDSFTQKAWFQFLCHAIMILSFCVFFHLPSKAFLGAVIAGMLSVFVLDQFENPELFVLASFTASLTVGLLSLGLARIYNWPSQVFSTTGILVLVPGLLALSSFYSATGTPAQGVIAYRVALTAGAITFGLFTARMPFRFYNSIYNLPVTK
jgi:uncharacterized membrane protein YjjP (DUF1212 family)